MGEHAVGCSATVGGVAMLLLMTASSAVAQEGSPGITSPTVFKAFDPNAPACSKPAGLRPELAFAKDNEREFIQGIDHGLAQAAKDRGLEYQVALAANDSTKMITDVEAMRAAQMGAVVVSPVDPAALAPSLQKAMWSGTYVSTVVAPPATSLLNAPQYLTGKELGDAAVAYIQSKLNGRADVVLLTQDSLQFLTPRFAAIRDALDKLPDVRIIADISPTPVSKEGGLATMRTVLLAHPNVDVVLGADGVVLGALQALREAGKDRPEQFLGGIDGEPEAIAEIKKGGSPYKATVSLNSPVFGYAMGQHAADWLEGKRVPQAMDILPHMITADNLADYQQDLADPGAVYADRARRDAYLRMYGSICYDTRDQYVNFPWSSEAGAP
ncbi:sugar ABC transporter substrate-binding protein [Mesorhizobium sp. CU2]|nr:sugar ABC transporter substrate-binding protein [Mesorhizobium sp. CU3]TPO14417.1 sugar ABC transporter substrate-binding protein [Mesorhizobium sp. CU2]